MLKVITDEAMIRKCHALFIRSFKPYMDKRIHANLGHQGASTRVRVSWSDRLGIWFHSSRISDNRYWNTFGIARPEPSAHIPITCEINFPPAGIDRRIGGVMARDREGRVFIVHRGKIGGGKKGIGKSLFENSYRGSWTLLDEGDGDSPVALIGELKSPRFVRQVTQFIRKVNAIKDAAASPSAQLAFPFEYHGLREELIGAAQNSLVHDESASCDHGLVVRDLYIMLKNRGFRPGNNDIHDLYIVSDTNEMEAVFAAAVDNDERAVHAAATRLLISALKYHRKPHLVLVAPATLDKSLGENLSSLGLRVATYEWDNNGQAVFSSIPDLNH